MNPHDSGRFCTESVESAAKCYKTLGFSIIPLHGARDSQHPKLPAIKWGRFQHTHASDEEIHNWFHNQDGAGIGIVCGRVSRLMVLDFDDASVASEFRHRHPDLVNTFTVRSGTRGLPHFYYRLPEGKLITTSAYPGADLRGEGSYVVAPPTCVGQLKWIVEVDAPIHAISEFELRRMMRFLAGLKAPSEVSVPEVLINQSSVVSEFRHLPTEQELGAYYHQLCGLGRNQALFKTAVLARDAGILETTCCFLLAPVHGREPGKEFEDYQSRYAEAVRTIASAYKRPPRVQKSSAMGLGNAAREWLLQNDFCSVARVLDGLYAVGMKPNGLFTELEACQKLAALKIGRRSISAALKSIVADKQVFQLVDTPRNPPNTANAANRSENLNNSCEMSRGAKRVKNSKRGRPSQWYRLPSPDEVAANLGVKQTAADRVGLESLGTPRAYREALHKKLLERRPGHYDRKWVADRLGVSRWTTRRYEKAANVLVQPSYAVQRMSWSQANSLPETVDHSTFGVFLEASDGKRYPAVKGLALRLLKQGVNLVLKHQQGNYYAALPKRVGIPTPHWQVEMLAHQSSQMDIAATISPNQKLGVGIPTVSELPQVLQTYSGNKESLPAVGIPTPQPPVKHSSPLEAPSRVGIPTPMVDKRQFWLCPNCLDFHVTVEQPAVCSKCGCENDWEILPQAIWQDTQALKLWWQSRYRAHHQTKHDRLLAPVKQDEIDLTSEAKELAEKMHAQIPNLSLANARKMVTQFGEKLIEKALSVVQSRMHLRSPAGFLISFLRSEHKLLNNNSSASESKSKPKGESAAEWLQRLAKSQYLNFLSNADDIMNLNLDLLNNASPA